MSFKALDHRPCLACPVPTVYHSVTSTVIRTRTVVHANGVPSVTGTVSALSTVVRTNVVPLTVISTSARTQG
eukprot:144717-Rhodomonas_salina.2